MFPAGKASPERMPVMRGTLRDGCSYLFAPAPTKYPTAADLKRLGVVPRIESCPIPKRSKECLPMLNGLDTIGQYVADFEQRNRLTSTDVSHLNVPISREWV